MAVAADAITACGSGLDLDDTVGRTFGFMGKLGVGSDVNDAAVSDP